MHLPCLDEMEKTAHPARVLPGLQRGSGLPWLGRPPAPQSLTPAPCSTPKPGSMAPQHHKPCSCPHSTPKPGSRSPYSTTNPVCMAPHHPQSCSWPPSTPKPCSRQPQHATTWLQVPPQHPKTHLRGPAAHSAMLQATPAPQGLAPGPHRTSKPGSMAPQHPQLCSCPL